MRRCLALAAAVLAAALLFYAYRIEPRWIEVTRYRLAGTPLAEALAGLRLVVVADPHVRDFGPVEEKTMTKVTALAPDYLILLGDYIDYFGRFDGAMKLLSQLRGTRGTLGVLGDADYSNARGHCILCHKPGEWAVRTDLPVRMLRDQTVIVENAGRRAAVVGLDAMRPRAGRVEPEALAAARGLPTLVLAHSPRLFDDLARYPVDLVLAGDNHGGQVRVPWPLSLLAYSDSVRPYLGGWFHRGSASMYVSRGTGTSHIPLRLGARPEIVVLDFVGDPS